MWGGRGEREKERERGKREEKIGLRGTQFQLRQPPKRAPLPPSGRVRLEGAVDGSAFDKRDDTGLIAAFTLAAHQSRLSISFVPSTLSAFPPARSGKGKIGRRSNKTRRRRNGMSADRMLRIEERVLDRIQRESEPNQDHASEVSAVA